MKLQQFRYLIAIADNNLSFTEAAQKIFTSQPGLSKQLGLLEDELQAKIFERNGKKLSSITPIGAEIIAKARNILQEVNNIQQLTSDKRETIDGNFRIATTLTQAKYVLPNVFKPFIKRFPSLKIDLQQGSTDQILDLLRKQEVDFAIASGNDDLGANIIKIPCYQWNRIILFPHDHQLGDLKTISIEDVAKYPIITYNIPNSVTSSLHQAFVGKNLEPQIVFTARDSDIIKTYVKNGFGIGIIASMAFEPSEDRDLIGYSAENILYPSVTWLAFNKNIFLRNYMKDFIHLFAPHITAERLEEFLSEKEEPKINILNAKSRRLFSSLPLHKMS